MACYKDEKLIIRNMESTDVWIFTDEFTAQGWHQDKMSCGIRQKTLRNNCMNDVIVIGAGPTGCTASKLLADSGYSVLLLERMRLPRYKSCSGCLIKKTMDLVRQYYHTEVPLDVACQPAENKGMVFIDDNGKEYVFPQPGLNVWRSHFDYWLAQKAVESGVTLWDNSPAISCEQDEEKTVVKIGGEHESTESAKYVIDCEGVTGSIKRTVLGCSTKHIYTYQTFNEGSIDLDYQYFYAFLQPEFSEYDAWFNVKDNQLVMGVAVKNAKNTAKYYDAFVRYMKKQYNLSIIKQTKEDRWLMPHVRPGCQIDYAKGRVFFAGETAGWLNPMGEGISCGMESAFHLVQALIENFNNPTFIESEYRKKASSLHEYMMKQWSFTGSMTKTFTEMHYV